MADAPLHRGSIIVAAVLDPQGENPKARPCVVVSDERMIGEGRPLAVIGITGEVSDIAEADRIDLPWQRDGHPRTGLTKPCAAHCQWRVVIPADAVLHVIGRVPDDELLRIIRRLEDPPTGT